MEELAFNCPYCGESISILIDQSAGAEQEYYEDCTVCCSPILLSISIDDNLNINLTFVKDNV